MADNNDKLSPDATPNVLGKATGVRRVNKTPIYIVGGAVGVFLLLMMLVAIDRSNQQDKQGDTRREETSSNTKTTQATSRQIASEITGTQTSGIVPADKPMPDAKPTLPPDINVPIARPKAGDLDAPPAPPVQLVDPANADRERIRQAKLQMLEEAVNSKTSVQFADLRSKTAMGTNSSVSDSSNVSSGDDAERIAEVQRRIAAIKSTDTATDYKTRIAQIRASLTSGEDGDASLLAPASNSSAHNSMNQFAGSTTSDRWKLDSKLEAPRTPYELRAGFVIPATMISGINSDLPGQVMAQVSQDVYDTATGKYKLIPQGCRLIGSYSSEVAYAQKRVLIAWQRIVFPDGKALDIGAMPGADSAGYSGFNDKVNNHYWRIFGSAFLMSGITAGVTLSQDKNRSPTGTSVRASDALSEALGQQLGTVMAQMITKNMNIAPTNEIRPGYRFNVMVIKDMTFTKAYQAFDY